MPKPSPISLVPRAIRPPPIKLARPPLLLEVAIAASAPGILSIKACTLSEGPSLRRNPRMMPMVLSATASSMPAFTASRPISSSILPRPQPVTCRILAYRIYLDLLRYELQAMTAFESAFVFDRVTSVAAMQEQLRNSLANCRGADGSLQLSAQESTKPVDLVSMNRVSDPPNAVDRVLSACKMQ